VTRPLHSVATVKIPESSLSPCSSKHLRRMRRTGKWTRTDCSVPACPSSQGPTPSMYSCKLPKGTTSSVCWRMQVA